MPPATWAYVDMPKSHGGTPNSASRGQRGSGSPLRGARIAGQKARATAGAPTGAPTPTPARYRFHQPLLSEMKVRRPCPSKLGCWTASGWSGSPPATARGVCGRPASSRSASRRVVASQGMSGWFQLSQARRLPSGERRGELKKSAPETSSLGGGGSVAAGGSPGSGIATRAAVSSPPEEVGRSWTARSRCRWESKTRSA